MTEATWAKRPYDLVKEVTLALVAVTVLTFALAIAFGSPDRPAVTLQSWAAAAPDDVVATAVAELGGVSTSAGYGPPYNSAAPGQSLGHFALQRWAGVTLPVDSANDLVLNPIRRAGGTVQVRTALATWSAASGDRQASWATAYGDALAAAPPGTTSLSAKTAYGPVPVLAADLLILARRGTLDGLLGGNVGQPDTKRLLLLADGSYLAQQAQNEKLAGGQWGMMNEAGNYPGQPWLWLYTLWYQVRPFSTSANADILVGAVMAVLTGLLVFVPFIPGLRSLPRLLKIHRLIWR